MLIPKPHNQQPHTLTFCRHNPRSNMSLFVSTPLHSPLLHIPHFNAPPRNKRIIIRTNLPPPPPPDREAPPSKSTGPLYRLSSVSRAVLLPPCKPSRSATRTCAASMHSSPKPPRLSISRTTAASSTRPPSSTSSRRSTRNSSR